MQRIVKRCTAPLPSDRYSNTDSLLTELKKNSGPARKNQLPWIVVLVAACFVLAMWRLNDSPDAPSQQIEAPSESPAKTAPQPETNLTPHSIPMSSSLPRTARQPTRPRTAILQSRLLRRHRKLKMRKGASRKYSLTRTTQR